MIAWVKATARWWFDFFLVVLVQTFMLSQVGVFHGLMQFKERRHTNGPCGDAKFKLPQSLSVVIPAFNEAKGITKCLFAVANNKSAKGRVEVVVVDAGCSDNTMQIVQELANSQAWPKDIPVICATRRNEGRGPCLNEGVDRSSGDAVMVVHADTVLPQNYDELTLQALSDPKVLLSCFSFQTDRTKMTKPHPPAGLSFMEWTVNKRSRWYGLPFGDQTITTTRSTLNRLGGYPDTCIVEDLILVNKCRVLAAQGQGKIVTLNQVATCDIRRWEKWPIWYVNGINQVILFKFRLGLVDPPGIFKFYYGFDAPTPKPKSS